MNKSQEKLRLKKLSPQFSSEEGFNSRLISFRYEVLAPFYRGTTCLELGSADGQGTKHLLNYFDKIIAVDGSKEYIRKIKKQFPGDRVTAIHALFEELILPEKYDTVILAHILEHVDNPVEIIKIGKKFLKKEGVLLIDVPNANSINRLVGVKMGLLKDKYELHSGDIRIGHRRVYDFESLEKDIHNAGMKVTSKGGVYFKPVANDQIEKFWTEDMVQGFLKLGEDYPELCSDIYMVCER
jgi:2-polyprenyl-3-methyl-5-hydroxy-6-metoxy-1,4-benzoquinol methylase